MQCGTPALCMQINVNMGGVSLFVFFSLTQEERNDTKEITMHNV